MPKSEKYMIGVDLGGTNMLGAVLDGKGTIVRDRKRSTKAALGAEAVTERIEGLIERLLGDLADDSKRVSGVCIAAPGAVDPGTGIVHKAPNLGWTDYPLASILEKKLRVPVTLDNDVNAGAVGELLLGAGRGSRHLVAIFVGTGIGGGVIINGELYYGGRGSAGEVGHIKILADGPVCGCGRRGCAEALASRSAMERDIQIAIAAGRETFIPEIMERDKRDRMTSSVIEEALERGDSLMHEVYQRVQWYLGLLTASVVNLLDPECVVIGGGLAERFGERLIEPIRTTARQHFLRIESSDKVRIVASELMDHAGAVGAALLAWKRFERSQLLP